MTRVLAIDGAAIAGFALGAIGAEPRFGRRNFSGSGASGEIVGRFSRFLRAVIEAEKPDVIAYEAPYVPTAWRRGPPLNAKTLRRLLGLAEVIDAIAWECRLQCYQATAGEVCAYLTGKANWGGRDAKKAATIAAARAWGWDVTNDDEADALAVWAYAESMLDPVAAAQRRARLGLELALHPETKDAPRRGSRGVSGVVDRRHKKGNSNGNQKNAPATGELQFPSG